MQRQCAQTVSVTVILNQTELGLRETQQQGIGRAWAQRDGLHAHNVAEQRVLGQALELSLRRLARRVGRHQSVYAHNIDAGHHQTLFHPVEEVTVDSVLDRSRHPDLFAQREHAIGAVRTVS